MKRLVALVLGAVLLGVMMGGTGAAAEGTPAAGPVDLAAAASYCTEKGGTVVTRQPVLGTNLGRDQWIVLGGATEFCDFQHSDGSSISLSLATLYSEQPTMAALAYLTKPPVPADTGGANPSAVHCVHLGGAYDFGSGMSGGGWIEIGAGDNPNVVNYCTFADGSMMDAWGITYHANGVVRGADLTPILRYQATTYPKLWG